MENWFWQSSYEKRWAPYCTGGLLRNEMIWYHSRKKAGECILSLSRGISIGTAASCVGKVPDGAFRNKPKGTCVTQGWKLYMGCEPTLRFPEPA
jgi:hypothetical protein